MLSGFRYLPSVYALMEVVLMMLQGGGAVLV